MEVVGRGEFVYTRERRSQVKAMEPSSSPLGDVSIGKGRDDGAEGDGIQLVLPRTHSHLPMGDRSIVPLKDLRTRFD